MNNEYIYDIRNARLAAAGLTVYKSITEDETVRSFLDLLEMIDDESSMPYDIVNAYHWLVHDLLSIQSGDGVNPWKDHILDLMLNDENAFSKYCQSMEDNADIPYAIQQAVKSDMQYLQTLCSIDSDVLKQNIGMRTGMVAQHWPGWDILYNPGYSRKDEQPNQEDDSLQWLQNQRISIKRRIADSACWSDMIDALAEFYKKMGISIFNKYLTFRWVGSRAGYTGYLAGVAEPDPIRLDNLIGYDVQRKQVIDNAERFVAGYPANNMLLYGDRGTGKSSTVKALIHRYGKDGLRLIEVSRDNLNDFYDILDTVRSFKQRFILFVDDLAFDADESAYTGLKAVLEGGIEARPDNVVIFATSNRRHLVKEYFSDRMDGDEMHEGDTRQEKLSLADRFGIVVTFLQPDQEEYLEIVDGLARRQGIEMNIDELNSMALQWQAKHNGRSGRTAAQFITYLLAHTSRPH
jgi:hypothetical protein